MMRGLRNTNGAIDFTWDGKGILVVGDTANLLLGDFDGDRPFDKGAFVPLRMVHARLACEVSD